MKQITVKQMAAALNAEVKKGNGDKFLVTADDNEGNGYHGVFFTITPGKDIDVSLLSDSCEEDPQNFMCIG